MSRFYLLPIMLTFVLLPAWGAEVIPEGAADVVVFKDAKGRTYAQVTSLRLAHHLKVEVGTIIASSEEGLSDAGVIFKAIKSLEGSPGQYSGQKWIKACGTVLIKRGVYDLGEEGIVIPWTAHLVIRGEGWDVNLPQDWKEISPHACPATYLVYRGDGVAFGHA